MNNIILFVIVNIIVSLVKSMPLESNIFDSIRTYSTSYCPGLTNSYLINKYSEYLSYCNNVTITQKPQKINVLNEKDYLCIGVLDASFRLCKVLSNSTNIDLPKTHNDLEQYIDKIQELPRERICTDFKNFNIPSDNKDSSKIFTTALEGWITILNESLRDKRCVKLCSEFDFTDKPNVLCSLIHLTNTFIEHIKSTVTEKQIQSIAVNKPSVVGSIVGNNNTPKENTQAGNIPREQHPVPNNLLDKTQKNDPEKNKNEPLYSKEENIPDGQLPIVIAQSNGKTNPNVANDAVKIQPDDEIKNHENPTENPENPTKNHENPTKNHENPLEIIQKQKNPPENTLALTHSKETISSTSDVVQLQSIKSSAQSLTSKTISTTTTPVMPVDENVQNQNIATEKPYLNTEPKTLEDNTSNKVEVTPKQTSIYNPKESSQLVNPVEHRSEPETNFDNGKLSPDNGANQQEYEDGDPDNDDDPESIVESHPESISAIKPIDEGVNSSNYNDVEDSNFFSYFMFISVMFIAGYVVYHNKQKILALVLEGRRDRNSRRRPNTASYRKLNSNLEEAVTSKCSGSASHVIY